MGSGASVSAVGEIEDEVPWDYSQEFIDGVRKEMAGADPASQRKLEFQRQVRLVGKSAQHIKLIRTMQAAFTADKKASKKKKSPAQPAVDEGNAKDDGKAGADPLKQNKVVAPEDETTESEKMQQLLLAEMKEVGLELKGELAEELERRRQEEEARKLAGIAAKKPKRKKKKGQSMVSIAIRLAGCSADPFNDEDDEEFQQAMDDVNGDDLLKTKTMLENFQFASPTASREALRSMDFPFVHGCIMGILERSEYQPDLLSEDEKDELKLADRRAEEVLLIKIASAVAYDLGTIDPEVLASESGPKGTDILPGIDIYHVCVGDLRQDLEPNVKMVEDDILSIASVTDDSKKKKKKPSGRYMSKADFIEKYGSEKRYNYMKAVEDPSVARAFLQYLCLAAGEVTSSNKRMHCPRRNDPDGDVPSTQREFVYKYGDDKGQELWEHQHPHREQERAIKREQERQRTERALLLRKEELAHRKLELEQKQQHQRAVFLHRSHLGYDTPCGCSWCLHNDIYNDPPDQFAARTGKLMPKVEKIRSFEAHIMEDKASFVPCAIDLLHAGQAADSLSCDFQY